METAKYKRQMFQKYGFNIQPYVTEMTHDSEDVYERLLPFLDPKQRTKLKIICGENDKRNFKCNRIAAQPDFLFESENGFYLTIEYKTLAGTENPEKMGIGSIRLKDMLQCLINSMQVSAVTGKPSVAILKYRNKNAYILYPTQELVDHLVASIERTYQFKKVAGDEFIANSVFVSAIETEIVQKFEVETEKSKRAKERGKELHDKDLSYSKR